MLLPQSFLIQFEPLGGSPVFIIGGGEFSRFEESGVGVAMSGDYFVFELLVA